MFCSKCGKSLPDGSRFCDRCGNVLAPVQPIPQPVYQPAPQGVRSPVHYTQAPTVLDVDSPSLSAMKTLARSPLTLIAVIALTVQLVMSIFSGLGMVTGMLELLQSYRDYIEPAYLKVIQSLETVYNAAVFAGAILPALLVIGLCITYGCSFKKKGLPTGGLTMIKVVTIINLVLFCIGVAIFVIYQCVTLPTLLVTSQNAANDLAGAIVDQYLISWIIMVVVFLIVSTLIIVFYARTVGMINAAKEIAETGRTKKKASVFVAVLSILGAVVCLLATLLLMTADITLQMIADNEMISEFVVALGISNLAWPTLISAITMMLFGIMIFEYRSKVQPLAEAVTVSVPVAVAMPAAAPVAVPVAAPMVAEPVIQEPVVEEPSEEEPIVEEPIVEEPIVEEPIVEEPIVEEPIVEEPIVEEPIVEEPIVEEPVEEEPIVEEPVVAAPVVQAPVQPEFGFCAYCGQKVIRSAKFCSRCGHPR